jgi:selenocysteine-specific elongation factor
VPPDDLQLAIDDIRGCLAGTFLEGAPLIRFEGGRPETFASLRATVRDTIRAMFPSPPERPLDRPFRMAIDRVFVMAGFGTVVTGTITAGQVAVGDTVEVLPSRLRGRVRGLQSHGSPVEQAGAGSRAAINLQGVDHDEVERGQVIAAPGMVRVSTVLDAAVTLLPRATRPVRRRVAATVHVGTEQVEGTMVLLDPQEIAPGESAVCQLRLARPVATLAGDPFIVRGFETLPGYGRTVGGGRILHPDAPLRRPSDRESAALLVTVRDGDDRARVEAAIGLSGLAGLAAADLVSVTTLGQRAVLRSLGSLNAAGRLVHFTREGVSRYITAITSDRLANDVLAALAVAHASSPDRPGVPADELATSLRNRPDPVLLERVLSLLTGRGELRAIDGSFALPGHVVRSDRVAGDVLSRVEKALADAGCSPPSPDEVAKSLSLPPGDVRDALAALSRSGRVTRIAGDLHFATTALDDLRRRLVAHLESRGQIATGEFKELAGVSRKYAIPLLEHFDSAKVTLRLSDSVRKLRR